MWQVVQHCHAFARSDVAEEHLRQGQITGHLMWGVHPMWSVHPVWGVHPGVGGLGVHPV